VLLSAIQTMTAHHRESKVNGKSVEKRKKKVPLRLNGFNVRSKKTRYAIEIERVDVEKRKCRLPLNINE
jgi:hypothetical protein